MLGSTILLLLFNCGTNPDKAMDRAVRAYEQQDWIGASLHAQEFINKFPEDPRLGQAYDILLSSHLRLSEFALARSVCEEILERFPEGPMRLGAKLTLGRTYIGEGNIDRALAIFSQIADSTANITHRLRAIEEAAYTYQMMASQVGSSTSPYWQRAISVYNDWLALADADAATAEIENITAARLSVLKRRAEVWVHAGEFLKAVEEFDTLAKDESIPELTRAEYAHERSANLRRHFNEEYPGDSLPAEARETLIKSYKDTIENFPDTDFGIWARVELCKLLKPTKPEEAEEYLSEAIKRYQKYVDNPAEQGMLQFYMTKIGDAYLHVEAVDRAEEAFKNLKETFKDNPRLVGYAEQKLEAIEEFRRWQMVKQAKEQKETDPEKAEELLTNAVQWYREQSEGPVDPRTRLYFMTKVVDSYMHVEALDQAEAVLQEIADAFPDSDQVAGYVEGKRRLIRDLRGEAADVPGAATETVEGATP